MLFFSVTKKVMLFNGRKAYSSFLKEKALVLLLCTGPQMCFTLCYNSICMSGVIDTFNIAILCNINVVIE